MEHHFIFVGGLHRSGTSIFFRCLREHPDMSGFENTPSPEDEGMHLQTVYKPSGAYGGAGSFGFREEAHLTEASPLITEANRQNLWSEWSPYWDLNKRFLLEKSPPNIIRTRFLEAMFPRSSFIILMRHPLAVSYATRAWYRYARINWKGLSALLEHWLVCHETFLEDRKLLKNNAMLIRYEDFVANPQLWLTRVQDMLGALHFPVHQKIIPDVNQKYFLKWKREQAGWLSGLNSRSLIRRFEDRCRCFGYSLADPGFLGPVPE